VSNWSNYREVQFDYNRSDLQASEQRKVTEIARYLNANPSLIVGLDGSMDPRGTDPRNQELNDRRVGTIRNSLIQAGVADSRIHIGAFGNGQMARDRQVAVLLRTAR
jgi:outer membrane protein OmpA-like peptidoglycan-associated protein